MTRPRVSTSLPILLLTLWTLHEDTYALWDHQLLPLALFTLTYISLIWLFVHHRLTAVSLCRAVYPSVFRIYTIWRSVSCFPTLSTLLSPVSCADFFICVHTVGVAFIRALPYTVDILMLSRTILSCSHTNNNALTTLLISHTVLPISLTSSWSPRNKNIYTFSYYTWAEPHTILCGTSEVCDSACVRVWERVSVSYHKFCYILQRPHKHNRHISIIIVL